MHIKGKRVLVTGGAGFIGSHLVEILAPDNEVTVLDDFSVGRMENLEAVSGDITIVQGSICDVDAVQSAVHNAEVIFHLAVVCLRTSIHNPMLSHDVNATGTLNLLRSAQQGPLERFIYVSSSEVYGSLRDEAFHEDHPLNPMTPYAASKLAGEAYALSFFRTYGTPTMVVRPFNTYGPRSHVEGASGELIPKFALRALAGQPLVVFGDGLQTRDYTWVGDTVQGIRMAGECDKLVGDCVNVAHGEEVSVLRVAHLVQRLLGTSVPIEHLESRPGDVVRQRAAVSRSEEMFGFTASVDLKDGLSRYVDWVKTLPGDPDTWLEQEEVVNWRPAVPAA